MRNSPLSDWRVVPIYVYFPASFGLSSVSSLRRVSFAISLSSLSLVSFSSVSLSVSLHVLVASPIRLAFLVLLFACNFVVCRRIAFSQLCYFVFVEIFVFFLFTIFIFSFVWLWYSYSWTTTYNIVWLLKKCAKLQRKLCKHMSALADEIPRILGYTMGANWIWNLFGGWYRILTEVGFGHHDMSGCFFFDIRY